MGPHDLVVSENSTAAITRPSGDRSGVPHVLAVHQKALRHNWDDGLARIKTILRDEACDLATALSLFWLGGAAYYADYAKVTDVPSGNREG